MRQLTTGAVTFDACAGCSGISLSPNRLNMLLAALHRRVQTQTYPFRTSLHDSHAEREPGAHWKVARASPNRIVTRFNGEQMQPPGNGPL